MGKAAATYDDRKRGRASNLMNNIREQNTLGYEKQCLCRLRTRCGMNRTSSV